MDTTLRDLINFCSDKSMNDTEILDAFKPNIDTCIWCDEHNCVCEGE